MRIITFVLLLPFLSPLALAQGNLSFTSMNPFGLSNNANGIFYFVDIDHDNDYDLFSGSSKNVTRYDSNGFVLGSEQIGIIKFLQNAGTAQSPAFVSPVENPFGLDTGGIYCAPAFTDIDNDGDYDAFVGIDWDGNGNGFIKFYRNIGTSASPLFSKAAIDTLGMHSPFQFAIPAFGDLDKDGDQDLLIGSISPADFYYEKNNGTATNAAFAAAVKNPFGLTGNTNDAIAPSLCDFDNDGDLDLIAGDISSSNNSGIYYYENTGSPAFTQVILAGLYPDSVENFPAFVDIDGDGDADLFNATSAGIQYYENKSIAGLGTAPVRNIFRFYPNPATDFFILETEEEYSDISISDITGNEIKKIFPEHQKKLNIDISDLSKGLYFIHIKGVKNEYFGKVVKIN
jgi:hypothetical protein